MQESVYSAKASIIFQLCNLALMFRLTDGLVLSPGYVIASHQQQLQ